MLKKKARASSKRLTVNRTCAMPVDLDHGHGVLGISPIGNMARRTIKRLAAALKQAKATTHRLGRSSVADGDNDEGLCYDEHRWSEDDAMSVYRRKTASTASRLN